MCIEGGLLRSVSAGEGTREGNEGGWDCMSIEAVKIFFKLKCILKWMLWNIYIKIWNPDNPRRINQETNQTLEVWSPWAQQHSWKEGPFGSSTFSAPNWKQNQLSPQREWELILKLATWPWLGTTDSGCPNILCSNMVIVSWGCILLEKGKS